MFLGNLKFQIGVGDSIFGEFGHPNTYKVRICWTLSTYADGMLKAGVKREAQATHANNVEIFRFQKC